MNTVRSELYTDFFFFKLGGKTGILGFSETSGRLLVLTDLGETMNQTYAWFLKGCFILKTKLKS